MPCLTSTVTLEFKAGFGLPNPLVSPVLYELGVIFCGLPKKKPGQHIFPSSPSISNGQGGLFTRLVTTSLYLKFNIMHNAHLQDMVRGWFVGDFQPTALVTDKAEVGVKHYPAGAKEERHHHRMATEVTLILSGAARMNGVIYNEGAIIVVEPNESTDFEALEDTVTVVVKVPGAKNDKYLGDRQAC